MNYVLRFYGKQNVEVMNLGTWLRRFPRKGLKNGWVSSCRLWKLRRRSPVDCGFRTPVWAFWGSAPQATLWGAGLWRTMFIYSQGQTRHKVYHGLRLYWSNYKGMNQYIRTVFSYYFRNFIWCLSILGWVVFPFNSCLPGTCDCDLMWK